MTIQIENLSKSFQDGDRRVVALDDIDMRIEEGSFTTIMGPSGCGKSTLLNVLAGLLSQDTGKIRRDGNLTSSSDLPIAYVFQEPRLLDWRTVGENIKFAMRAQGVPSDEHDRRITDTLSMVGLGDERDSYPLRLSGGQRQRVGIARALSVNPDVLLMDEPFSELDEISAHQLRDDLIDLWQETGKTVLFVTHDISEAIYLSDKILFLDTEGHVFNRATIECDRPREPDDPRLSEIETTLMDTFFEHMERIERSDP
ncbi:MAG: ABC transporter ATP-binding protein [Halorubrum sp.]